MAEQKTPFITTDTSLAAFLVQEGFELIEIKYEPRGNGRPHGSFIFDNSDPKLKEKVSLYNRGEAITNLALYEHARSNLLDRIMRGLP